MTNPPDTRLRLPALDPVGVAARLGWSAPEPFRSRARNRAKQALGDATGLQQFGVNLVTLQPGDRSALRHWHDHEDEFVYVLSGELLLHTDAGAQVLRAGDCAGFPAGSQDAHCLENASAAPAQYLEIGSRDPEDRAHYPDDDVAWERDGTGRKLVHKDGTPWDTSPP